MPSPLYINAAKTALDMISRFGAPVTVKYSNKGEVDLVADDYVSESPESVITVGVSLDWVFNASKDNENTRKAEKKIIVPAKGLTKTPTTEDRILQGGVEYSIIWVEDLNPADISLIYTIFCKR